MPSTDLLTTTRESLHRVAEHLVAATRKRATGDITLVVRPDGFGTPQLPDGRTIAVVGTDLVVRRPSGERRAPLTTLAEAAATVGVVPGFPWTKHPPGTAYEPHAPLTVDPTAAAALARWFALGQESLSALAAEIPAEHPTVPQIFPEHFDLGITAGRVNYGFSPGDDSIPTPYAYVGPHDLPTPEGDFWNAPFGAYRTWRDITTAREALEFLRAGRRALGL